MEIPSQNNLALTVQSIITNSDAATSIGVAVCNNVQKLVKTAKNIEKDIKKVKNINKLVIEYASVSSSIINTFCKDLPEGKNLNDLLGRIEEYDKDANVKKTKYTIVDSIMQIPNIINSVFSVVDKLKTMKLGFNQIINFRKNINILKSLVGELLKELMSAFSDLATDKAMDVILGKLVKQPDKTLTEINKDVLQDGEYSIYDKTKTNTLVEQGQLGLLDVFEKTFSLIGLLNNLKVPNLIKLKIQIQKIKLTLSIVLLDLLNFTNEIATSKNTKNLQKLGLLIAGDGNDNSKSGLLKIVQKLTLLLEFIKQIKYNAVDYLLNKFALKRLKNTVGKIVNLLNSKTFDKLNDKDFSKRLILIKNNIDSFTEIFQTLAKLSIYSLIYISFSHVIIKGVEHLGKLITSINKNLGKKNIKEINIFDDLSDIIDKLYNIEKQLVLSIIIAPLAIIGMLTTLLFVGSLILFIKAINWLSKYIDNISEKASSSILKMNLIFGSIIVVCATILTLALIAPLITNIISLQLLGFIGLLFGFLVLTAGLTFVLSKITQPAVKESIKFAINTVIITGSLIIVSSMMLILAIIANKFDEMNAGWSITKLILGLVGIIVAIGAIGVALSAISPIVGAAVFGLAMVVVLVGMLLGITTMLDKLSNIKLNIGEYKENSDNKVGNGTGIIGNVSKIMFTINYVISIIGKSDLTISKRNTIRTGKKVLRQVKRVVKQIIDIADNLNSLQKIKLNKNIIFTNVSSIFTFVKELDIKINDFLSNKTKTNGINPISDSILDNAKSRKKEMKATNKLLNKVEKVITNLNEIGQALSSIQKLKLTNEFKANIENNIKEIFGFIDYLDKTIKDNLLNNYVNSSNAGINISLTKKELRQSNKKLSKLENTILTIKDIGDALNTLKDLKISDKDGKIKEIIKNNITYALDTVKEISEIVLNKSGDVNFNENTLKKVNPLIKYINSLNDGFKDMGNVDSTKVKTTLDNYIKFVDKINTIEVEKVQTTANMFKQMSEFSNSIKGDFDKLTEALSDNLLPVLTELKEVMNDIPEKLEVGFQETNASIGAQNSERTRENIEAQVKRENKNLSKDDIDTIVQQRLSESARFEANSINAKLDALISLLSGTSGMNAIVKTI